jgi:hypothetical protein
VVVDDYFPCETIRLGFHPKFAHSKVIGEFWMCLLEKAWAKLRGSYARIIGGKADLLFFHLTSKPTQLIYHRDKD